MVMSCFDKSHAFGERARGVPDLQTHVPQHVENEFDDALAPRRFLVGPHEKQIDVGAGRQLRASIAARRHHGEAFGLCRILRVVEMLGREIVENLDDDILQIRKRARGLKAGHISGFHRVLHARAGGCELRLDMGECGLAQARGIAFVAGDRGQLVAQAFAVDQFDVFRSLETQGSSSNPVSAQ